MKPTLAVLAIVALSAACSRPGSDERAFEWTSELPPGAVVHLRNGSGDIEVKRASGPLAQVVGSKQWRKGRSRDINFVVTRQGKDYYICAMWRNSGKCASEGYRGKNTRGFLAMFSLFNRNTDATAEIIAELPAHVTVDVVNTQGEVSIEGITGGVRARTVNGEVKAVNVGGRVTLESTNGDLTMSAEPGTTIDALALTTTNGEIDVELPDGVQGTFDLSTTNGDVRSDFPLEPTSKSGRHLRGQIGSAERRIKLRSVNGDITVKRAAVPTP